MAANSVDDSMSLFSDLQISEDRIRKYECLICLELLFKPKVLPCSGVHTFCENCLQRHIDTQSFTDVVRLDNYFLCPVCKGRVIVPEGGSATDFQTNYYISDEVDRLRANLERKCDICSTVSSTPSGHTQKATRVCSDCSHNLCKACSKLHSIHFPTHHCVKRVMKTTPPSNADVLSARERDCWDNTLHKLPVASSSPERPKPRCSTHPSEELRFFCRGNKGQPCGEVICRDCRITDHFHHGSVTDLTSMVQASSKQLLTHEKEIESRIQECSSRQQNLSRKQASIRASTQEVKTLLEARAQAMVAAVIDHKDRTVHRLQAQAEEADNEVSEDLGVTQGTQSSLQDMLITVQHAARAGSDVNKVRVSVDMTRLLEEEESQATGGGESSSMLPKGFLLNSAGPVDEVLSEELLADLIGKIVRL
ncbi:hypothetical protein ACOMHN_052350 [Nucella lapillus]